MIRRILQRTADTYRRLARHRLTRIVFLAFIRGASGAVGTALVTLLIYWITH